MTVNPDPRSLLVQIDLMLSQVVSSLVNPRNVSIETLESIRQQLEQVRISLLALSSLQPAPVSPRWQMGIEVADNGVKVVFFKETEGTIDLYPLSWSLETGESDRLPREYVERDLIDWLCHLSPTADSWLGEALENLAAISIGADGETATDDLKNALITAKLSPVDRVHRLSAALATAIAHVPTDPLPHPRPLLVIQGGKGITEFALVEIPTDPRALSPQSMAFARVPYGEEAFIGDLLAQSIYPRWLAAFPSSFAPLDFPEVGSLDLVHRDRCRGQLALHPLGKSLQEAARLTQWILQDRSEFTSPLAGYTWTVSRAEIEQRLIVPLLGVFKREIAVFLGKQGKALEDISEVIFNGEFFRSTWPWFSSALTEEWGITSIVPPPSTETLSPVILGLGRLSLFPALGDMPQTMGETGQGDNPRVMPLKNENND